jgi:hypothetical protein
MNFDEAIIAHSQWKLKLRSYVAQPDGSLKAGEVQLDNKCSLGQWLYGEGQKYSGFPEYATLKEEHAKFHKAAADIIRRADAKQDVSKELALGQKSDFLTASSNVINAITALRKKAE